MPPNRALYDEKGEVYDIIVGNFIIAGLSDEDFTDIQEENIEKFLNMYMYPETFFKMGNRVIAIKDETNRDKRG
ncbi:hypothetical protein AGMMS49992_28160 [Clostridia bacterium]|nr:hypothetical protein AGMMS49992_28160 [Clostridia bacterium]